MDKHRAIPQGYMTVGALAKKMGTTVRTLQYYDNEGLLSPSAESEGGRRLYTDKDVIRFHQIQAMKYLGFSLDDIKNRLVFLDTPEAVAGALTEQAASVREKISALTDVLSAIEALKAETLQMESVDWRKYADIVAVLQSGFKEYWAIKLFDGKMLERVRDFDVESGISMLALWKRIMTTASKLQADGILPGSLRSLELAKEFWGFITEFTGGDMNLLPELLKFEETRDGWDEEWESAWETGGGYIQASLGAYFESIGYDPFEGVRE